MKRFWRGTTKNGEHTNESLGTPWQTVKDDLISLEMVTENGTIILPDNMEYIQGKTASATLGASECTIESRYIGFSIGNNIVKVRVNEQTGNIQIELD